MATAIVQQGQGLIDVAVQHCGSATALVALAVLNGISVTEDVVPGQILDLPEVSNTGVAQYFLDKQIVPATQEATAKQYAVLNPEGIGYWKIEDDFIVQ